MFAKRGELNMWALRFRRLAPLAAVTAVLLSGCIVSGNGGKVWLSETCNFLCDETVIGAEKRVEYVRVTGTLTFDGTPVAYDEFIRLSYTAGTRRDGILVASGAAYNRDRIVKQVGNGVLSLDVISPRDYVWDGSAAALETAGIRPDVPRLRFRWISNTTTPAILETYETASYFQRPDSRIKVKEPLRFSLTDPTPEIEALSEAQAKLMLVPPRIWSQFGPPIVLYPIPRKTWSKATEVAAFIAARAATGRAFLLDRDLTHKLAYWSGEPNLSDAAPVRCSAIATRCLPLLADRGYSLAYAYGVLKGKERKLQIDLGEGIIPLAAGESIYDPKTDTIYQAPWSWSG
jgi:hypothetical protein